MIERMLANTLLVLGVVMLVLVIDFCFRKYLRLLLWVEGISAIVGTLPLPRKKQTDMPSALPLLHIHLRFS